MVELSYQLGLGIHPFNTHRYNSGRWNYIANNLDSPLNSIVVKYILPPNTYYLRITAYCTLLRNGNHSQRVPAVSSKLIQIITHKNIKNTS